MSKDDFHHYSAYRHIAYQCPYHETFSAWNSRDGQRADVVACPVDGCNRTCVARAIGDRCEDHKPRIGDYILRNMTLEEADAEAAACLEAHANDPNIDFAFVEQLREEYSRQKEEGTGLYALEDPVLQKVTEEYVASTRLEITVDSLNGMYSLLEEVAEHHTDEMLKARGIPPEIVDKEERVSSWVEGYMFCLKDIVTGNTSVHVHEESQSTDILIASLKSRLQAEEESKSGTSATESSK